MAKNMCFYANSNAYKNGVTTVTRRFSWWTVKPGDVLNGVTKRMDKNKTQEIIFLGQHVVTSVTQEPLIKIVQDLPYGIEECIKEGFDSHTPAERMEQLLKMYPKLTTEDLINRIEFEHLDRRLKYTQDRCPFTYEMF